MRLLRGVVGSLGIGRLGAGVVASVGLLCVEVLLERDAAERSEIEVERRTVKLFETAHLPPAVNTVLSQIYEAYDGSGVPLGTKGEEISLGARILSAVDSFLDLTKNPANAQGKTVPKAQALEHLRKNAGVLYDPVVADIVGQVQSGELLLLGQQLFRLQF
jgi:response regulator RpfG family c-di-GMP phosphodiesterase